MDRKYTYIKNLYSDKKKPVALSSEEFGANRKIIFTESFKTMFWIMMGIQ